MALGLLGKKLGMSQIFDADGKRVPVTLVEVQGSKITQIKTQEKDGYTAVQVAFEEKRDKNTSKPLQGHFKKAGTQSHRHLVEFRVDEKELEGLTSGAEIGTDLFEKDQKVDVSGTTKGRGFAGVMKRHNFAGFRATHGTHEYFRHGGSIGCCFPQHVIKGKKMPGHYGASRVTTQNLSIVDIDPVNKILKIKGAIPGAKGGLIEIRKAVKIH